MSKIKTSILVYLALMFAIGLIAPPMGLASGDKGWIIRQKSPFLGANVWYITERHVKSASSIFTLIVDLETYRAIMYSIKSGKYIEMSVEDAAARCGAFRRAKSYYFKEMKLKKDVTVAGLKGKEYVREGLKKKGDRFIADQIYEDKIDVTDEIKFPPRVVNLLSRVTLIPHEKGFPTRAERTGYLKGRPQNRSEAFAMLDTLYARRSVIPDSEFKVPRGLTETTSELELLMNDDNALPIN